MSPGAYLDNLEVMMKKCYELTTAVTLPSVEQIVRIVDDALHNTDILLNAPQGTNVLGALRCIHIDCIQELLSQSAECLQLQKSFMFVLTDTDIVEMEKWILSACQNIPEPICTLTGVMMWKW